jgi:hypothetical protein
VLTQTWIHHCDAKYHFSFYWWCCALGIMANCCSPPHHDLSLVKVVDGDITFFFSLCFYIAFKYLAVSLGTQFTRGKELV